MRCVARTATADTNSDHSINLHNRIQVLQIYTILDIQLSRPLVNPPCPQKKSVLRLPKNQMAAPKVLFTLAAFETYLLTFLEISNSGLAQAMSSVKVKDGVPQSS